MAYAHKTTSAKWFGKNNPVANSQPSELNPIARLGIRLVGSLSLISEHPELDDELRAALSSQAQAYQVFMNDAIALKINIMGSEAQEAMQLVRNFCELVESELSDEAYA